MRSVDADCNICIEMLIYCGKSKGVNRMADVQIVYISLTRPLTN